MSSSSESRPYQEKTDSSEEKLSFEQQQLELIKKFYNTIIFPFELEEETHNTSSGLNLLMVSAAEIGIPLITGFVGMHDVLVEYLLSYLSTLIIYCVAAILAIIDAAVNSALLVPMFRKILKTSVSPPATCEELRREQLLFYKRILNKLTDPGFYDKQSFEDYKTHYEQMKFLYKDILNHNQINSTFLSDSIEDQVVAVLKWILKWFLIAVFLALRASSGYFILTKFFLVISLSGFVFTVPGLIITGIVIGLFLYSGYKTRHDAIDELIYSKEKEADELNRKINKISALYIIKKDHMELVLKNKNPEFKRDDENAEEAREFQSCVITNLEVDYLLIHGFASLKNLIDNKTSLIEKNRIYEVYKNSAVLNIHHHRYLDHFLFYRHTRPWKKGIKEIRDTTYEFFLDSIRDKKPEEKIKELEIAKRMPIFNEHRNNWLLFTFGRTATVKKIDQEIDAERKILCL